MKFIFLKLILLCLIGIPLGTMAQQRTLHGIVRDNTGAMIGVNVVWENKEGRAISGVTTNENGEYWLPFPSDTKDLNVVFSFIGMKTQKFKYTNQKVLNVTLEEDNVSLDEVVISVKMEKRNSMGINAENSGVARQKLDLDEFQDMAVTSVEDILQGKMTNVDIIMDSGDPGAKSSIRIRGTSSLNSSNEPLIVIDDVPMDISIGEDFEFGTATTEDFGALVNIAPSDIANIEVLKDAAATALYGPQAAAGVLLITTKRGTKSKPRFTISHKTSVSWEPKSVPMLNASEYRTLMQDALWNAVQYKGFNDMSLLTMYPDVRLDKSYEYYDEFNQNTDWLSLVVQTPVNNETNFSMSGGGDRAVYYFSVGYMNEKGTTIGTDFTRITARLNLDYRLSKRLTFSSSFSYSDGNRNSSYKDSDDHIGLKTPRAEALRKMPNMSPWVLDDNGNKTDVYFTQPKDCIQGLQPNPVAMVYNSNINAVERSMNTNFVIDYKILSCLVFNTNIAFGLTTKKSKGLYPSEASGVVWSSKDYNRVEESATNSMSLNTRTRLTFNKLFGRHQVTFSGIVTTKEYTPSGYGSVIAGIGSGQLADASAGGKVISLSSDESKTREIGLIGTLQYGYASRYYLTAGIRSDATSKTGRNSRWGTFPTLSLKWRLNNENFLKEYEWLSDLSLSGGWGRSGKSPSGSFTYVGTFDTEDAYMDQSAVKPTSMQLNKLKWEVTTSINGGLKLGFLKDKITVDFDYYKKQTSDLLQKDMSISSITGYSKVGYFNSGKTENRGWELAFNFKDIIKINGFTVSINNLNVSRNRNRVLELPSNRSEESYTKDNGKYAIRIFEGQPLGAFYGYNCLGVYQNLGETVARNANGEIMHDVNGKEITTKIFGTTSVFPGDAKYADHNHDGIIDQYDMVYLGNAMPIMTGGGSIRLAYKGWSLRTSFHFRLGQKVINRTRINTEAMYNGDNQRRAVLKRWRYEGDDTDIPRALFKQGYNYLGSDRFVENNSFLKCKDLTLSYNFPSKMINRWGFTRCNVYVTTYNLFTVTKYKGQDPETGIPSNMNSQLAEDTSMTPRARKVALGLSLSF